MDKDARREYQRQWAAKRRQAVDTVDKPVDKQTKSVDKAVDTIWQDVDTKIFDGHGRGVPINGYVLVTRRSPSWVNGELTGELSGVVTEQVLRNRLTQRCKHNLAGWSCKPCLP